MATPTNLAKAARMTAQRDQLNNGALVLLRADATVLASYPLASVSGSVSSAGVLTFATFPKSANAVAIGDVDRAELRTSGGQASELLTAGVTGDPDGPFDVTVSTVTVEQVGQVLSVTNVPTLTAAVGA